MGTPDTSAGIGDPDSLVSNLVYQGDMLNQGEVYWETGELFGLMNTEFITVSVPDELLTKAPPPLANVGMSAPVTVNPSSVRSPVLTLTMETSVVGASMVVTPGPPVDSIVMV